MAGLRIERPVVVVPAGALVADRRLCVDRTWATLLEETSPDVAALLAAKGQEIPADVVARMGLVVWSDGRVMQGREPKPEVNPIEGFMPTALAMPEPVKQNYAAIIGADVSEVTEALKPVTPKPAPKVAAPKKKD